MATFRPQVQHQGPACSCKINDRCFGWLSCTCYAGAMGIDKSSLGKHRPSGCTVRRYTGDRTGGTMVRQVADVALKQYGIKVDVHAGGNVLRARDGAAALRAGRGILLQGGTGALVGTKYQSTAGQVNHAVWVNEIVGDGTTPDDALVYDPAADGRKRSYRVDESPSWWPWALVLKFASWLEPAGEGTGKLGPGWWYCGVFPDTEPHVILKYGGKKTSPFPDRTRAQCASTSRVNVRSSPTNPKPPASENIVGHLRNDEIFVAYQVTDTGESFRGSRRWYGSQNGNQWVHAARLSHEGGTT